jgi:hypothetical protein
LQAAECKADWTWQAVLFPIPCELTVKGNKHSAYNKQSAEKLQLWKLLWQSHSGKNLFRSNIYFSIAHGELIFTYDGSIMYTYLQIPLCLSKLEVFLDYQREEGTGWLPNST